MTARTRLPSPAAFAGDRRGAVMIEFALIVPLLVMLLLGAIDAGRLVLAHQKADNTAATIADLVARASPFQNTPSQICAAMDAAVHVFEPFALADGDAVRVTSITLTGTSTTTAPAATANWQAELAGGSSTGCAVTELDTATTVPADLDTGVSLGLDDGDQIHLIVGEMVYTHDSWFWPVLDSDAHHPMTLTTVLRPRQSSLAELLPDSTI
jgi:Flp pilus assembly protein TadG